MTCPESTGIGRSVIRVSVEVELKCLSGDGV